MAKQTINIGAAPNDGTGTPLRTSFDYCNQNFTELYTATGPSGNNIVVPGSATITGDLTVATDRLKVVTGSTAVQIGATTQTQIGTTAWPSTDIGKSNARFLVGNEGIVINWNESSPVIGNYSSIFAGAKTGIGATTIGGLQIRAGIENASNRDGFCSFWTSNQAAGGYVKRYEIDSNGVSTWSVSGSTAMTLNATGLGVGVAGASIAARMHVKAGSFQTPLIVDTLGYYQINMQLNGVSRGQIFADATNCFAVQDSTNSFTRFLVTDSGNVGVGVTPSEKLDVYAATGDCNFKLKSNAAGSNVVVNLDYVSSYGITRIKKSGTTVWETGVIGSTSATPSYSVQNGSGTGVYLTSGATSWTGTSDERLKDIIEPISNAVSKVGSLRSVIGKFKTDSEGTRRSFLIAQDVKSVLPEAVDSTNADALGVRYTEVIPLLVAAIQELTAEVNALKNA